MAQKAEFRRLYGDITTAITTEITDTNSCSYLDKTLNMVYDKLCIL